MITTLGFSILVELAHHRQGQSPILMLVGLFFLHFLRPDFYTTRMFSGPQFGGRSSQIIFERDRKVGMNLETLDYLFPFVVFFYGALMVFVLENKALDRLATERMPSLAPTLRSHKGLAWVCLFVGGLWALQNLWLGTHI